MTYAEYLTIFNKYNEFNLLISEQAKIIDFSNKECKEALQKWLLNWSNVTFKVLKELFKKSTGPKDELEFIKQTLKDIDFMRTYLETFGVSFLNVYCGYSQSLSKIQEYIQNKPLLEYNTEYNQNGNKIWKLNGQEHVVVDLDELLKKEIKIDPLFIEFLTLVWSQTKIKQMIISSYLQKN